MQRRQLLRVLGGTAIVAASAGTAGYASLPTAMPAEATAPWQGPGADAVGDLRRQLLSYAMLAPHAHNLQSWAVDLSEPNAITLYCDLERLLPQTDPLSRQVLMSHGTFLELLDLAARQHGMRADIRLFPQGVFSPQALDARPVARIVLVAQSGLARDPLFAQVQARHTNRAAYDGTRPVPAAAVAAMRQAAGPGVTVGFVGMDQFALADQHRTLASQAWRTELTTPRTVMESMHLLRVGTAEVAQHRDGIHLLDTFPVALDRLGLLDRNAPPAGYALDIQLQEFDAKLASTPGFLWVSTADNSRTSQIAAGRAYVRAQLAATQQGLSFHPLSQALQEYPEQVDAYRAIHALTGATAQGHTLQMWVRVGYAPPGGPSPRRPLQTLIRSEFPGPAL